MVFLMNISNGIVDNVLMSEIADLALNHGYNKPAGLSQEISVSRWYEIERALASRLPGDADIALTHGSERDSNLQSLQEFYLKAA
jgi:hypothetical protein